MWLAHPSTRSLLGRLRERFEQTRDSVFAASLPGAAREPGVFSAGVMEGLGTAIDEIDPTYAEAARARR